MFVSVEGQGVYGYAERLADWGIKEMQERFKGGFLDVASLIAPAAETASSLDETQSALPIRLRSERPMGLQSLRDLEPLL